MHRFTFHIYTWFVVSSNIWKYQKTLSFGMFKYQNVYIIHINSLWKFGEINKNAKMKIPLKRNKIKGRSIACNHIWHIDISKCVYWLDTLSVKVWWNYAIPNTNADHFCDIIFRHRAVFPSCNKKQCWKSKIRPRWDNNKICPTFSKYFRPLHKLV